MGPGDGMGRYNYVLVRYDEAVERGPAISQLRALTAENGCSDASCVLTDLRPRVLGSYARLRGIWAPALLALGALLVMTLAHGLVTSVRARRHDLAILGALGLSRGQTRRAIVWEAVTLSACCAARRHPDRHRGRQPGLARLHPIARHQPGQRGARRRAGRAGRRRRRPRRADRGDVQHRGHPVAASGRGARARPRAQVMASMRSRATLAHSAVSVVDRDPVDDRALDQVLEHPAQVRGVDAEHRRARADQRVERHDRLVRGLVVQPVARGGSRCRRR